MREVECDVRTMKMPGDMFPSYSVNVAQKFIGVLAAKTDGTSTASYEHDLEISRQCDNDVTLLRCEIEWADSLVALSDRAPPYVLVIRQLA